MGRQINFLLHPEDIPDFELVFSLYGEFVLLPYYHFENKVNMIGETAINDMQKETARIYLVRKCDFSKVKLVHIEKFGYWLVEDGSPVIEYERCYLKNDEIQKGRLYYRKEFFDNKVLHFHSDEFIIWAENILKASKRKLKKHFFEVENRGWGFTEYVGLKAKDFFDRNK